MNLEDVILSEIKHWQEDKYWTIPFVWGFSLVVKNLSASAGDTKDTGLIPGSRRSPGGENGNPLQYSCLKNPMDGGAWWAAVHGVTKSQTWLSTVAVAWGI